MANLPFQLAQFQNQVSALPPNQIFTTAAGGTVTSADIQDWVEAPDGTLGHVVEVYIELICHYANSHATMPGQVPVTNFICQPYDFYRDIMTKPDGFFRASQRLRNAGITAAMMQQAHYFFIPIEFHRHVSLVVVSPRDQSIEIMDSWGRRITSVNRILALVLRWIKYEFGPNFNAATWVTASGLVPRQDRGFIPQVFPDDINCGSFACQYAMSTACGDPLQADSYEWLVNGQVFPHSRHRDYERARIAAEIMHGDFSAPYNTHPITPQPGANRRHTMTWTPVNSQPELLKVQTRIGSDRRRTAAARRADRALPARTEVKAVLVLFCRNYPPIVTANGPVQAFAGYSKFTAREKKAGGKVPTYHRFLEWIEDRLDDIAHGLYP